MCFQLRVSSQKHAAPMRMSQIFTFQETVYLHMLQEAILGNDSGMAAVPLFPKQPCFFFIYLFTYSDIGNTGLLFSEKCFQKCFLKSYCLLVTEVHFLC